MIYDLDTRTVIQGERLTGVIGQISWQRLTYVLRAAGELRENERVVAFQVDPEIGLSFKVETKRG